MAATLLLVAAGAAAAPAPLGLWRFVDDDAVIEVLPCAEPATLCARLRGLPNAAALAQLSPAQRQAAPDWCGRQLIGALALQEAGQWRGGWLIDPYSAARYHATLRQPAPERLELLAFEAAEWWSERMVLVPWRGPAPACP
ncbi:DUF2147 domain-containing protein [Chitiniphilus purpureus]|uniref:DUF2147 domain-containing protein n=1 Tax=Chitiniphilus purpureus TaxID=2981137 RepID=A0ABY6DM72_9NEIS|nr:DUF2147 domain-containing protein [Chitiniphilus sp. CD1]UXY15474.1 DUF2147 domain-containing protein [Chitiniphilus sp. CD1]